MQCFAGRENVREESHGWFRIQGLARKGWRGIFWVWCGEKLDEPDKLRHGRKEKGKRSRHKKRNQGQDSGQWATRMPTTSSFSWSPVSRPSRREMHDEEKRESGRGEKPTHMRFQLCRACYLGEDLSLSFSPYLSIYLSIYPYLSLPLPWNTCETYTRAPSGHVDRSTIARAPDTKRNTIEKESKKMRKAKRDLKEIDKQVRLDANITYLSFVSTVHNIREFPSNLRDGSKVISRDDVSSRELHPNQLFCNPTCQRWEKAHKWPLVWPHGFL